LEDITFRAVRTLKEVDLIAAEDTRHSGILLKHYGIQTPCTSFHSYSTDAKTAALVEELRSGKNIALITDAGTPGISDPAWALVKAALAANVSVVPIPGAAAFLTALMGSGLPMNEFVYLGFVPAKKAAKLCSNPCARSQTTVLYESPHRIKTVSQMLEFLGPDRVMVIARELTKMHETFHRGTLAQLNELCKKQPLKGEMVLILAPANFQW
jgi:16S rRNA (cytidine1402-2'-O)-methyltransferase